MLTETQSSISRLVDQFNRKNVIVSISPGWVGNNLLRSLFDGFPETTSTHKRSPQYRDILEAAKRNYHLATRFFLYSKASDIISDRNRNYIETSHSFGKGFFEPCMALGFRPKLIFVTRPRRKTALSMLYRSAIPGRTTAGRRHLIEPGDDAFVKLKGERRLSDYQLCYWYSIEMEMRSKLYQKFCLENDLAFSCIKTLDLNDLDRVFALAKALDLVPCTRSFHTRKRLSKTIGKLCEQLDKSKLVHVPRIDVQESELLDEIACYGRFSAVHDRIGRIKEMYQRSIAHQSYPSLWRSEGPFLRA